MIITTGIFSDLSSSGGVQIVAAVTAHSAALDTVTARMTNTSAHAVFIPRCGLGPLLSRQQFVNGAWSDADNPACPAGSALSPIQLDPGLTLVVASVLTEAGRFRFITTVGESEDFSNSARATSNSFSVLR